MIDKSGYVFLYQTGEMAMELGDIQRVVIGRNGYLEEIVNNNDIDVYFSILWVNDMFEVEKLMMNVFWKSFKVINKNLVFEGNLEHMKWLFVKTYKNTIRNNFKVDKERRESVRRMSSVRSVKELKRNFET